MKLLKSQNLVSSLASSSSSLISHSNTQISNHRNHSNSLLNKSNNNNNNNNNQINNSVHLICNGCGKNIYSEIPFLPFSINSATSKLNMDSFSINPRFGNTNNQNKYNDLSLFGCVNCKKFLPQCSICLRLMKINLNPNSNNSNSAISNPSQFFHPFMGSPKLNIYGSVSVPSKGANNPQQQSTIQQVQLPFQLKSPNSSHSDISNNNNNHSIKMSSLIDIKDKSTVKPIFSNENMLFLKMNKFGKKIFFSIFKNIYFKFILKFFIR